MKLGHLKLYLTVAVALFLIAPLSFGQSFLTNGLVAYYPFNGDANDASGNGLDGTVSSNYCRFVSDRFGNSNHAIFTTNNQNETDAVVSRIDIPAAALDSLNSGTITAWIKPGDITTGVIIGKQHNGVNTYAQLSIGGYYDSFNNVQYVEGPPGTLYFGPQNFVAVALKHIRYHRTSVATSCCGFYRQFMFILYKWNTVWH